MFLVKTINQQSASQQYLFWIFVLFWNKRRKKTNVEPYNPGSNETRKPRKGAAVIAASMHGFANCRKFKSPVTLTLDRVKVTSIYTVRVELVARPTMWL